MEKVWVFFGIQARYRGDLFMKNLQYKDRIPAGGWDG